MSRKIEDIIGKHNALLETGVREAFYLEQKIKSRCREITNRPSLLASLGLKFLRLAAAHALLLFILVFANFSLINAFQDKKDTLPAAEPETAVFMAAVPGSISSAYLEVNPWEK
ncbi:MAG: hypothetical protein KAW12_26100 [Candidatus Aminicenantes bacterium]|nr:hypothetical protein [Candidatus Aminicenantes bacterium]